MSEVIQEFICATDPNSSLEIVRVTEECLALRIRCEGELNTSVHLYQRACDSLAGILLGPIPMTLWCPQCGERHVDEGVFAKMPHHTHSCQECGLTWRPAVVATVGVQFLPGFKNEC